MTTSPEPPAPDRIRLKRAYDPPDAGDGTRVLVDRLWPRGVRKADAGIDLWMKEISPSDELRKWYHHDRELWDEFRARYRRELAVHPEDLDRLRDLARAGTVTLIYSAQDTAKNNAVALRDELLAR